MAKINTNVNPYYDDFDESKNYQRILFKPGVAVQARELTQLQTVIYNQIKRFANHIFQDGTVIQKSDPSTIQPNEAVVSVKLTGSPIVSSFLNKFVTGATSNVVGKVIAVYQADDPTVGDLPTIVVALKQGYDDVGTFGSNEILYFYNNYSDAVEGDSTSLTAQTDVDYVYVLPATTDLLTDVVTVGSTSGIKVGDYLENADLPKGLYVTEIINSTSFRTNKRPNAVVVNNTVFFYRKSSNPIIAVGISEGVYYKNGYFIKVDPHIVVVDKYERYPTKSIILKYTEEIITSDDDITLLDPALGSSNYFARGADRLKVSLVSESVDLTTAGKPDYNDEYIELVRYKKGIATFLNEETQYSEIDNQIQKRAYDTSGNFFIQNFALIPYSVNNNSTSVVFSVSPGTAFVGGKEVKSISNYLLGVDKARTTSSISGSNFSTKYGSYVIIQNPSGVVIPEGEVTKEFVIEAHSVVDPVDKTTLLLDGIVVKHIEFHGTEGSNTLYKMFSFFNAANVAYSNNKRILSYVGVDNNSAFGSLGNGRTYANPYFKANVNIAQGTYQAPNPLEGNTIIYDSTVSSSLIFPLAKPFIKSVTNINVQYGKRFGNLTATAGVINATVSLPENFVGGAGSFLSSSTILENYYAVIKETSGTFTAGQYVRLDTGGRTVAISSTGTGLTVDLNDPTFSGKIDLYATIDNDNLSIRQKTLVENYVAKANLAVTLQSNTLPNADIRTFKNIFALGSNTYSGGYSVGTTYTANTFVSNGYSVYKAVVSSTGAALSNTSAWLPVDPSPPYLYILNTGSTSQYIGLGSIQYVGATPTAPGNVLVIYDYYLNTPTNGASYIGPAVAASYPSYSEIPNFTFDGVQYNLRDSIDFRPIVDESSYYTNNLTYKLGIVPSPKFTDSESTIEYYLGRKDRLYVVNNEASDTDYADIFYVDTGVPSETPVVNSDLSDSSKQSICILDIPPYTNDSTSVDIIYNFISRYTMKDIGVIDSKLNNIEKIVNRHEIELTGLAQRVYKPDGSITLNVSIFTDDFSTQLRADRRNKYYSATINTNERYCAPIFDKKIIPLSVINTSDVGVAGGFVTTKNTEEYIIRQTGVSHFNTVNLAEASVDTGRIRVTPEIIVDYGSGDFTGGGGDSPGGPF
jgi:hypothetical protein